MDLQIFGVMNGMTIECDEDIANHQATVLRRAILINFDDEQSLLLRKTGTLRGGQLHPLAADAQVAAFDIALPGQCVRNAFSDLDGNCQRYPIHQPGRQDADDIALCVYQRASREARIRDGVGPNIPFENRASSCAQWPPNGTDNARTCHWPLV